MAFHTVVIVVLMVFITVVIAVEIAVHTVVTWYGSYSARPKPLWNGSPMVLKVVWIVVRTVVKNPETAVNTVVATVWMAETVPEKKLLMPFHTVSKNLLMLPHTVCQSVPNRPRKISSALFKASSVVEKMDLIPS